MKEVDYEYELSNGWGRWENLVLSSLKELKDGQKELGLGQKETTTAINDVTSRVLVIETTLSVKEKVKLSGKATFAIVVSSLAAISALTVAIVTVTGAFGA